MYLYSTISLNFNQQKVVKNNSIYLHYFTILILTMISFLIS
nr:MAG TPA: hypothetical protein [Caudoviricetes sp.]